MRTLASELEKKGLAKNGYSIQTNSYLLKIKQGVEDETRQQLEDIYLSRKSQSCFNDLIEKNPLLKPHLPKWHRELTCDIVSIDQNRIVYPSCVSFKEINDYLYNFPDNYQDLFIIMSNNPSIVSRKITAILNSGESKYLSTDNIRCFFNFPCSPNVINNINFEDIKYLIVEEVVVDSIQTNSLTVYLLSSSNK